MKSFETFHAVLAAYIPVSVLAGIMPLSALMLEHFIGTPLPLGLWFVFSLISAVSASVYWAAVKKSKADHSSANIRGAVLIIIISYALASVFDFERPFVMRFYPSFHNIPPSIFALAVWFPVVTLKKIFAGQELFESNAEKYEGDKLRQIMLEDSSLMSETDADMKKISNYYAASFIPSVILMFVCGGLGLHFSAALMILLTVIFALGVCIESFLGFMRREYSYAAEGLILPDRPKTVMAAIITLLSACTAGLLFSSDKSILSPSLLMDLLRRIQAFFDRMSKPVTDVPPPQMMQPMQDSGSGIPPELLEMTKNSQPSPFWDYLKYAILVALAVFFIWFMINPLLSRTKWFRGLKGLPIKIIKVLKEWLKSLADGAVYFFKSLGRGAGGNKLAPPSAAALHRLEEDILGSYSAAKRRELRRSISLFARLIYWGSEVLNVSWKPSHAPIEYCILLADKAQNPNIKHAGELFEKALYSLNPLTRTERNEFKNLVETITAENPTPQSDTGA
ncbi:MAG: hypothetical protein FWD78_13685 [Treponema sp.]|nr:hypothetical protein [Treponema sp.]